jgi:hypothetical protein
MVSTYYCKRCGKIEYYYHGNEDYSQYGCKYCFDLPFGFFRKEVQ